MSSILPLNPDDLLRQRTVEGDRIDYTAGRNPDAVGRTFCPAVRGGAGWQTEAEA